MVNAFDMTVFFGDYPFRGFSQTSLQDLAQRCKTLQISGAAVSSFQQIFHENNLDAARRDAKLLESFPQFAHFVVVNPTYPRQLEELQKVLLEMPIAGLRLLPNYHHYHLWDARVQELFALAKSYELPVQIHREIQDRRLQWMLSVLPLDVEELEWLLSNPPEIKVLLSGLSRTDLLQLQAKILAAPNIWVDTSRLRGPVFGLENLTELLQ